jgi:hypothetical protein
VQQTHSHTNITRLHAHIQTAVKFLPQESAQNGRDLNLFFMTSPYCRTLETTDAVMDAFENDQVRGGGAVVRFVHY